MYYENTFDLKLARTKFVLETVAFFSTHPRAIEFGKCIYRTRLEDGTMLECAIGRHLKFYWADMEGQPASKIAGVFPGCIKPEVLDLGIDFLECVQALHDSHENWNGGRIWPNERGLTRCGMDRVEDILWDYGYRVT